MLFKEYFYVFLKLLWLFCSAKWNNLCNFGILLWVEHMGEIMFNRGCLKKKFLHNAHHTLDDSPRTKTDHKSSPLCSLCSGELKIEMSER